MVVRLPLAPGAQRAFVELYPGLTYRQFDDDGLFPGGEVLHFDLLKPLVDERAPLVVFVKGGGFRNSHRARYLPALIRIAEAGVAVASIEYRTSNQGRFEDSLADVKQAIGFLRDNGDRLGIHPHNIALWGNSAGATLAVQAGASLRGDEAVRAIAGWYGVYDPSADSRYAEPGSTLWLALGDPNTHAWFGPSDFVHSGMPPVQLIHGTDDAVVDPSQSVALSAELARHDVPHELIFIEGGRHSFAQLCTRSDALARTSDFLIEHLQENATAVAEQIHRSRDQDALD